MPDEIAKGQWAPFKNYTTLCLGVWSIMYKSYCPRTPLKALFHVLKMTHKDSDGKEHAFDPRHLPETADHFVRNVRRALPLLSVYEFAVPQKKKRYGAGEQNVFCVERDYSPEYSITPGRG